MKYRNYIMWGMLTVLAFTACSKEEDGLIDSYTAADFIENFEIQDVDTVFINSGNSIKCYVKGIEPNDKLVLEKDGVNMNMAWGYMRRPVSDTSDPDGIYRDSIIVKIARSSEWTIGDWNIKVRRGDKEDNVGTFNFALLSDVQVSYNEDLDKITVSAKGWNGTTDDIFSLQSEVSDSVIENTVVAQPGMLNEVQNVEFFLPSSSMVDGNWKLSLNRWEFGLGQQLKEFPFIRKGFVDDEPIRKVDGKYKVQIKLNRVLDTDELVVATQKDGDVYELYIDLKDEPFENNIVTVTLPTRKIESYGSGIYYFNLDREGIKVIARAQKEIIVEEN